MIHNPRVRESGLGVQSRVALEEIHQRRWMERRCGAHCAVSPVSRAGKSKKMQISKHDRLFPNERSISSTRRRPNKTRSVRASSSAHRDDEGEVDADGKVRHGEHVEGRQLDILQGLDEALQVSPSPADRDQYFLHEEAERRHKPAVHSFTRNRARPIAPYGREGIGAGA